MKILIYIYFLILLTLLSSFAKATGPRERHPHAPERNTGISDLINFEAIQKADIVELLWDIKSRPQHAYFTLERSKNGVHFEKITTIDAGGDSNNLVQYIETDRKPLKGKAYYRIKITDTKNKSTYSNIITVNNEKNNIACSKEVTDLRKITSTPVLVVLSDSNGREYFSKVQVSTENSNIIGRDHENRLSPGIYTIKATSYNALYSQKLIVK